MHGESYWWEEMTPSGGADAKTVVLVGIKRNGKSAAGNSIIGRQVFESMRCFSRVTSTRKLESTVLDNGQILNVIDTPGLFEIFEDPHERDREIRECVNMAKDGVHAFLLVLSLRWLVWEEKTSSLLESLGGKIADYMIVLFAHGDFISQNDFLTNLLSTLNKCGNRFVIFDNVTKNEEKICSQRKQLLSLVDAVVESNGGKPYTNNKGERNLTGQSCEGSLVQFRQLVKMMRGKESIPPDLENQLADERAAREEADVKALALQTESKNEVELMLKESIQNLEKQLAEERAARIDAEMKVLALQTKSKDEVSELKECLNRSDESHEQLQKRLYRVESIHNIEKQLAEERAARMQAEMKALSLQTKSRDDVLELKYCLYRAEESRKQLEERLHRVESIHTVEKQLSEERTSRPEVETTLQLEVRELKVCLNRAEVSCKQLEERLHRVEKQLTEESAARIDAEMKALCVQSKSKEDVLELKECLNRVEESCKQLKERLHGVESIHAPRRGILDWR